MRRLAPSLVTVASFAVAAFALVAGLYGRVTPFSRYRWVFDGTPLPLNQPSTGRVELTVFLVALAVACLACLWDARRRAETWLHRLDYFFVLVGGLAASALVAGLFVLGRMDVAWHVFCLALLLPTAGFVLATTLVRLRAGTIGRTVFWVRVFHTFGLRQFSGIFILSVVVGAVLLLLSAVRQVLGWTSGYASIADIGIGSWLWMWFSSVGLPAAALAVVAVLCRDLLAITAAKERAVEARLREERFRAELITNVTHDIRTPLTSIVNYVDLIDKLDLEDPRLAEYTEVLGRKSQRLKVLIGDLLDASRASAGNLPVRLEPIEVTEILAQIAGDFDDAFAARGLVWVGPSAGHDVVEADGEHLWRILENLVGNVVKYAKPGSCVHADLFQLPGVVRLQLTNRTAEPVFATAEQLMSQFGRGDAARHSEGSGLGLFIADRLARLMGASLTVAVDGDRFTARVDLPAGRTQSATEQPVGWEPTRPFAALEPTRPIELEPTAVLVGDRADDARA